MNIFSFFAGAGFLDLGFESTILPSRTITTPTLHTLERHSLAVSKSIAAKSFIINIFSLLFSLLTILSHIERFVVSRIAKVVDFVAKMWHTKSAKRLQFEVGSRKHRMCTLNTESIRTGVPAHSTPLAHTERGCRCPERV